MTNAPIIGNIYKIKAEYLAVHTRTPVSTMMESSILELIKLADSYCILFCHYSEWSNWVGDHVWFFADDLEELGNA